VSCFHITNPAVADIQSGFLLWTVDRLISLARMVAVNKLWLIKSEAVDQCGQATIEVLDGEVMRLTMRRDMHWEAGQHA
jgi:ferric-chelate reductase